MTAPYLKFISSSVGSRVFWKVLSEFQRDRLHQLAIISCILSLLFLSTMEVQIWSASTFPYGCFCLCFRCGQHLHSRIMLIAWIIHDVPGTQSIHSLFLRCYYNLKFCRYFYWHNLQFNFQVIQDDRFDQRNTWGRTGMLRDKNGYTTILHTRIVLPFQQNCSEELNFVPWILPWNT